MRGKTGKKIDQKASDFSLLHWAALLGVALFLFIFPFKAGLFNGFDFGFEANLYESILYAATVLLMIAFYLIWHWRINDSKSWMALLILVLPLCYMISASRAVSSYNASLMVLIIFTLAGFYIFGLYLAKDKLSSSILSYAIQMSAYMIIIFGVLNLFGQIYYPDAMWNAGDGFRLASVFQYSNAYAAYLTAALLGAIYLTTRAEKWYMQAIHALMLVPIIISFMLTYSRGGIVVIPLVLVLLLPFLAFSRQIWFLIHFAVAGVSSLAILGEITLNTVKIAQIVQPSETKPATVISAFSSLPLECWGLLLGASVFSACVGILLQRKLSPWLSDKTNSLRQRRGSSYFVPAVMVGIGTVLVLLLWASSGLKDILPTSIADRLASINFQQHSVLERKTFYLDALKVSRDYPLIGAGGGAWASIYEEYQNNPYISRQAHSYLLQTLVEVGWIGLIILLLIVAATVRIFIKLQRDPESKGRQIFFYIVAISLLLHSMIDFDMSYIYLAAIVFLCLGAMAAPYENKINLPQLFMSKEKIWRFSYPTILVILSITVFAAAYREYRANQSYSQAAYLAQQKGTLKEIMPHLDEAIRLSPTNPAYLITKMDWMSQAFHSSGDPQYQEELRKTLETAQLYDPYNRIILLAKYRYLKEKGDTNAVLQTLEEGLHKFQWDIKFYEVAIMEYYSTGKAENAGNTDAAKAKWQRALELYRDVLKRQSQLKSLPKEQLQGRAFDVTPMMGQAVGQIYYYNKDYSSALKVLELNINGDINDPNVRTDVRFYLAALKATGSWNEELYNRLIAADPGERELLHQVSS